MINSRRNTSAGPLLGILPKEVLMFKIFRFVNPKDLFYNVQAINSLFQILVWKSVEGSGIFDEKVIIKKKDFFYLYGDSPPFQPFHKSEKIENSIASDSEKDERNFICPSLLYFYDLLSLGCVDIQKCGMRIFEYLVGMIESEGIESVYSVGGIFYQGIFDVMQLIVDFFSSKGRKMDKDSEIESSYFNRSFDNQSPSLLEFYLSNKSSFRIPQDGELTRYFSTTYYGGDNFAEGVLILIKDKTLFTQFFMTNQLKKQSQRIFEEYIMLRRISMCECCDGPSSHINDFFQCFNNMYLTIEKEENYFRHVHITKQNVDEIISHKNKRMIGSAKKLAEFLKFIEKFGLYEICEGKDEVKELGDIETNSIITGLEEAVEACIQLDGFLLRGRPYQKVLEEEREIFYESKIGGDFKKGKKKYICRGNRN